jgi:pimeloyl-ACP methyl ester carboxylesterase
MTQAALAHIPEHLEHRVPTPDGRILAVAEWGDPDGVPLLMIHGTPGSRIGWPLDLTLDTRHGIRRLTFDRPGFGESTRRPGRSVVDVVPDVVAIADALGVDQFVVAGGSGGGPHALACAALLPDRVRRCGCRVPLAPSDAPGLDWFAGMTEGNVIAYRAAREGEAAIRELCERWAKEMLDRISAEQANTLPEEFEVPESDVGQMQKEKLQLAAHMTTAVAGGVDGWVDDILALNGPWGFDAADVRVPVLLEYGRHDTLVPAAHGDWLAAHIPNAQVNLLDSGHLDDSQREEAWAWFAGGD